MDALILAAGLGTRIGQYHHQPKGFLSINGMTLIDQSIKILRHYGIDRIGIVAGYQSEMYENLANTDKHISIIHNPDYAVSGSLLSWYKAKDWIQSDFILLESDIIYSEHIIEDLINCTHPDAILVSELTGVHDAVLISAQNQFLTAMDKDAEIIKHPIGELVGISKLCVASYQMLIQHLETDSQLCKTGNYETDGLVWLANYKPVYCQLVQAPCYCEIDDLAHLQLAISLYPQIRKNSRLFR